MTAVRVVTDHEELDNIGEISHGEIDQHINETTFLIVSGTSGPIPATARKLTAGTGVTITDGGAGGNLTISTEPSSDGFLSQEKEAETVTSVPDKKTMMVFGEFTMFGTAEIRLTGSAALVGMG